jgi:hypothetical protein
MTKTKRVQTAAKHAIANMIERFFAAKGYYLQRKRLISGGPSHLRVWHNDKDHDGVEKDWHHIYAFCMEEFAWVPDEQWGKYGHDLYILIGRIKVFNLKGQEAR